MSPARLVMPHPDPHPRKRRARARARLEAERRTGRERGRRRAGQLRDHHRTAGARPPRLRPARPGGRRRPRSEHGRRAGRGRARGAARRRRRRRSLEGRASPCSVRVPPPLGSNRARRSATRSPRRRASRWPRSAIDRETGSRGRALVRHMDALGRGVVVKADGLAGGKGVTSADVGRRGRRGHRARAPERTGRHRRSGSRAARPASSHSATVARRSPCLPRVITSDSARATRAPTPAGWAPTARSRPAG